MLPQASRLGLWRDSTIPRGQEGEAMASAREKATDGILRAPAQVSTCIYYACMHAFVYVHLCVCAFVCVRLDVCICMNVITIAREKATDGILRAPAQASTCIFYSCMYAYMRMYVITIAREKVTDMLFGTVA